MREGGRERGREREREREREGERNGKSEKKKEKHPIYILLWKNMKRNKNSNKIPENLNSS